MKVVERRIGNAMLGVKGVNTVAPMPPIIHVLAARAGEFSAVIKNMQSMEVCMNALVAKRAGPANAHLNALLPAAPEPGFAEN